VNKQEQLIEIGRYVRELLQQKFGQELAHCEAFAGDRYLVVFVRGFVSAMEGVLLRQGQLDKVAAARAMVMESSITEYKTYLKLQHALKADEFYQDWSYENNTGVMIALLKEEQGYAEPPGEWQGLQEMEDEINRISHIIEQTPRKIAIVPLTPRMLIVQRDGILILLEKVMVAKGYIKELRATKADVEKDFFHHQAQWSMMAGRELEDLFVDWNFESDRSIMCLMWK